MEPERSSLLGRALLAVMAILVTLMLAYALYVGLTPPESGEPTEPYNIQHLTPVLTLTENP